MFLKLHTKTLQCICQTAGYIKLFIFLTHNKIKCLETHLHDVLDQWCPAGQLIGLLAHTLLPVDLFPSAEGGLRKERIDEEVEIKDAFLEHSLKTAQTDLLDVR